MKRVFSIALAVSIFFCFSVTSFAVPSPSSMDNYHSNIKIKLSDAPKATYDFFYKFSNSSYSFNAVIADAANNYNVGVTFITSNTVLSFPHQTQTEYTGGDNMAFIYDNKITYSRINGSYDYEGLFSPAYPISLNFIPITLPATFFYNNVRNSSGDLMASIYYNWKVAVRNPPWDFIKNTSTVITYDVDITKTYEEYQASLTPPPSSSSEPTTPPVDPPVDPPTDEDNPGLIQSILDGLKSIFIPDEDYFTNYYDEIDTALNDKIGGIKAVLNDLTDDFNSLVNSNEQQTLIFTLPDNHFYSGFQGFTVDFLVSAKPFLNFLRPILNGLMAVILVIFCYKSITKMFE